MVENVIETDVLVIGGGMAGMFAALKAKAHGPRVTLIDKGVAGRSGATHFAEGDFTFFNPEVHNDMHAWIDQMVRAGEYLNNRKWCRILLEDSYARYKDMISWGVQVYRPDGRVHTGRYGPTEHHCLMNREYAPTLRQCALDAGISIIDRIMLSELVKQDGRIAGGIGFHTTTGDLYVFKTNAVVLAAGGSSIKNEAKPIHYWTSDGHAMGYRAGAVIAGKEFIGDPGRCMRSTYNETKESSDMSSILDSNGDVDILTRFPSFRAGLMGPMVWPTLNAEGGPVLSPSWEAHCGRAPLFIDYRDLPPERIKIAKHFFNRLGTTEIDKIDLNIFERDFLQYTAGRESAAQNIHGGCGIWPVDTNCASNIPGLYCAGNNCATMVSGAAYAGMGIGLCHAAVTGARAGTGAAEYAAINKRIKMDADQLAHEKKKVCSPMERKGGFGPRWATQVLQGFSVPYFIFNVKHETRLQAALTFVEFMNQHLVPKLKANDPHEWRLAQEAKNMVLNAEMALRASLFRTESRGAHFREDFPRRDDPEWLAWVKLQDQNGEMKLTKEPIPQEDWPDMSIPYGERYPKMIPLEDTTIP
jgi:succinate dehydrogenase/fumarate reductase flavoprotein subunit